MKTNYKINKTSLLKFGVYILPPVLVSLLFFRLSQNEISIVQCVLAMILLTIPWSSYLKWKLREEPGVPVFAIVSFMIWIYFALSLFWGPRTVSGKDTPNEARVSEEAITAALELALVGILAIWLGMRVQLARYIVPKRMPILSKGQPAIFYIRFLLVLSGLLGLSESIPFVAGEGARQILTILVTTVPILAFAILFRGFLRGESANVDKALVAGFLALRFVIGLSSGWLGSFASLVIVCGAVYLLERRKVPRLAVILVVIFTLFFQVGKKEFREAYWQQPAQTSKIDRVKFWAATSFTKWGDALTDPTGVELDDAMNASLSRMSLLTQSANVIEMTPCVVPYQYGRLYSYLAITWIPRFVWPDKPTMNEANRFYQLAYGLSNDVSLEGVSISVGTMTEAYISFGWFGLIGIMFLLGIFYDVYQRLFFARTSGALMVCIGIALLPQVISVEAQMGAYVGGIVQQVLLTLLVFLPVIRLSKRTRQPGRLPTTIDYQQYSAPRTKLLPVKY
jgi:hypothetical protein